MNISDILILAEIWKALGAALTTEQQLFISANQSGLLTFLHSDAGKAACKTFVTSWEETKKPSIEG